MIPMAVIGLLFYSEGVLLKIKYINVYYQIILMFWIYFLFNYNIFLKQKGYRFSDIILNSFASIFFFLFFSSIHLDNAGILTSILKMITKYTGGIYYLHMIIYAILNETIFFQIKETYFSSSIIYIVCYSICFVGHKLFQNNKIKYLFL